VQTLKKPGRHADGGGLYLVVSATGASRKWTFVYRWKERGAVGDGKHREMGLGSAAVVGLAEAREKARLAREDLAAGRDPMLAKLQAAAIPTFGEMADTVVTALEHGWRNPKHRNQWRMTLTRYCERLRDVPVDQINTAHVMSVLQPMWLGVPETASRLRGRIERVLNAAKTKGYRTGENPAQWRGHLENLLPKRQQLSRGHHRALPYQAVPALIQRLRSSGSVSALCLEFAILTAARSGEAMGARWSEVNFDAAIWTVPPERMKAQKEHRVPLSPRALEIVRQLAEVQVSEFVFPGQRKGRPLSTMALMMVLRRMAIDATPHGFRSAFRDWAAEQTHVPREVAEAVLAHTLENKVEAAYRRTDFLEKRRELLNSWGVYCYDKRFSIDYNNSVSGPR
jgi:integrase